MTPGHAFIGMIFLAALPRMGCSYSPYADRQLAVDPDLAVASLVNTTPTQTLWKVEFPADAKSRITLLDVNTYHLRTGDQIQFVIPGQNAGVGFESNVYTPDAAKLENGETTLALDAPMETIMLVGDQDRALAGKKMFYVAATTPSPRRDNVQVIWVRRRGS